MTLLPRFKGHILVPGGTNIKFMRYRDICFGLSIVAMLVSIALFVAVGLNYGVDFKGGLLVEVKSTKGAADLGAMRSKLGSLGVGGVQIQTFGAPDDVLIRVEQQPGGEKAQQEALNKIIQALGSEFEQRRVEVVGPAVSSELRMTGIIAVVSSILAIILYVWFRFEWQFALGTVVALAHDVLVTVGLFVILQLEFDLSIVAALLTILGYSVNDTVVVSDRIRENLRKFKRMDLTELLDRSLNETLSRTIMTSLTTVVVLSVLYAIGGEVLRNFSFAMLFGIFIGTYSSIFVAAPLLSYFGVKRDWSGLGKDAVPAE